MKYEYLGGSTMTVNGQIVKDRGDIVEVEKPINHISFKLINDDKIKINYFHLRGNYGNLSKIK